MKIKINLNMLLKYLCPITLIVFIIFAVLVLLQNQIANIDFLNRFNDIITFKNIDNFQDILVILGMIPKMIVILFLLFVLKRSESNNRNTFSSNVVQIIFGFIYTYFIYINLFTNSFFIKYVSNTFIVYQLINILLLILFIFGIIYTLSKLRDLYKRIKQKSTLDVMSNYEVYFYPIIVVMFIYLIINLVNIIALKYIVYKLLTLFSLQSLIDISSIINLPLDANLSQVLPEVFINFFEKFNVNLDISLSDLNINLEFINTLFDNIVLSRIDKAIDNFLIDKINTVFFTDFYTLIILVFLNIGIIVNELIKKYNKLINVIFLLLMSIFYFNVSGLIYSLFANVCLILIIIFLIILIRENKELIKKYVDKVIKFT